MILKWRRRTERAHKKDEMESGCKKEGEIDREYKTGEEVEKSCKSGRIRVK